VTKAFQPLWCCLSFESCGLTPLSESGHALGKVDWIKGDCRAYRCTWQMLITRRTVRVPSSMAPYISKRNLVMPQSLFPRRYFIDDQGCRVLIGLTVEQTREFELLDLSDSSSEGDRASSSHGRWHELYQLHQQSWQIWRAEISEANLSRIARGQATLSNPIENGRSI
jgi:hypothetical protein